MNKTFMSASGNYDLTILPHENGVQFQIATERGNYMQVTTHAQDAAAQALEIIEAAGVKAVCRDYESYDDGSPEHLQAVMYFLKQYNEARERVTAEARERALSEVTSVEELEALPVGSIIADLYDERGNAPVVLCKALNRDWAALTTGTQNGRPWWTSEEIAQVARRLRVLHRPDVKP